MKLTVKNIAKVLQDKHTECPFCGYDETQICAYHNEDGLVVKMFCDGCGSQVNFAEFLVELEKEPEPSAQPEAVLINCINSGRCNLEEPIKDKPSYAVLESQNKELNDLNQRMISALNSFGILTLDEQGNVIVEKEATEFIKRFIDKNENLFTEPTEVKEIFNIIKNVALNAQEEREKLEKFHQEKLTIFRNALATCDDALKLACEKITRTTYENVSTADWIDYFLSQAKEQNHETITNT